MQRRVYHLHLCHSLGGFEVKTTTTHGLGKFLEINKFLKINITCHQNKKLFNYSSTSTSSLFSLAKSINWFILCGGRGLWKGASVPLPSATCHFPNKIIFGGHVTILVCVCVQVREEVYVQVCVWVHVQVYVWICVRVQEQVCVPVPYEFNYEFVYKSVD